MNFLDNFIDIMKFENVIMLKILSDVLKRIYLSGKFLFWKRFIKFEVLVGKYEFNGFYYLLWVYI